MWLYCHFFGYNAEKTLGRHHATLHADSYERMADSSMKQVNENVAFPQNTAGKCHDGQTKCRNEQVDGATVQRSTSQLSVVLVLNMLPEL